MFVGQTFPPQTGNGFYISHPWFRWVQPFTITPPKNYDAYLLGKHLIPEVEADAYMWFYDGKGFIAACNPISKPPEEKDKQQDVPPKRILGMGFHLVNVSDEPTIEVDHDGFVKTTKNINVNTELVM